MQVKIISTSFIAFIMLMSEDINATTLPVDLLTALGVEGDASPEEIDQAYHEKMRSYRRAHRPDLFQCNDANMRMAYHDFERAAQRATMLMRGPFVHRPDNNNTSHYYLRSSVSTMKDGVFKCRVIENVNGDVKEYEEESTDIPDNLMSTNHVASKVKRKHVRWKDME